MTIKEEILEVLKNEDLTVNQIIKKLPGINKGSLKTNLTRLQTDKLISTLGSNERNRVYTIKKNNSFDTQILKKMIPLFLENDLDLDLSEEEFNRVKELYEEISENA